MQKSISIDTLIELIGRTKSSDYKSDHTFLLLYPSNDQYLDFIKVLYKYCKLAAPSDDQIPLPLKDLLNYTYIKEPKSNQLNNQKIEVYTILENLEDKCVYLLDILKGQAASIDVFLFEDCDSSDFTTTINSFIINDADSIKKYIKSKVLPLMKARLDYVVNSLNESQWKSATVLFSNVSLWTYNSMTIPIVDFIQQYIRRLLLECNTPSQLVYLPSSLLKNDEKLIKLCGQLIESQLLKPSEDQDISYDNIHTVASFDSITKIQLLDESFSWSEWNLSSVQRGDDES